MVIFYYNFIFIEELKYFRMIYHDIVEKQIFLKHKLSTFSVSLYD